VGHADCWRYWLSTSVAAMDEKYAGLVGRDDGMFVGCDCTAISLRLEVCAIFDVRLSLLVDARFVDCFFFGFLL